MLGRPITRRDGPAKNAEVSGGSVARPIRTRLKAPLPAGTGSRTTEFFSSQSKSAGRPPAMSGRSEEHTSELQSQSNLVCRLLLEKKKTIPQTPRLARRGNHWRRHAGL